MKKTWHCGLPRHTLKTRQKEVGVRRYDDCVVYGEIGANPEKWRGIVFSTAVVIFILTGVSAPLFPFLIVQARAQTAGVSQQKENGKAQAERTTKISYDERLRFYINLQTKDFLIEMTAKESLLLQTIKNLIAEIEERGIDGLINDDPGFEVLYKKMETLMESYAAELEAILAVLDEITALSRTLEKERQYGLAEQVGELKTRLVAAIENRELYKKAPATSSHVSGIIKEYGVEVDSLLRMYSRLQTFQKSALAKGDTAVLPLVEEQKAKIMKMVGDYKTAHRDSAASDMAEAFLQETEQLSTLLAQLDSLGKAAAPSLESTIEVEARRRDLVLQLDDRLLALLGYNDYTSLRGPTIEQVFDVWRKERIADYQTRLAEYTVMKTRLLETGSIKERSRMLERDLTDALLNYAAESYLLAELQFNTIMQDYGAYFSNWDAIIFYRSESLYARAIYPAAYESYEELLRDYPKTRFLSIALLRLLTISHTLKWEQPFFNVYTQIDSSADSISRRIVERARYLAGYYCLNLGRYEDAQAALEKIPPSSKYHFAAQYLLGITQANRGNLTAATPYFNFIVEKESNKASPLPGVTFTDPSNVFIFNNALMRLGFIYYQRAEYQSAIGYFERVSRGASNYDQTLTGLAWAHLKKGDLDQTIRATGTLLSNHLASNYQYEAMVLSAHCRKLLEQPQEALKDLRYVTHARGALERSKEYNEERQQILAQLGELKRMEKAALDHRDKQLYELVAETQQTLVGTMFNLGYLSNTGSLLIEDFSEERQEIYRQIQRLDRLVAEANAAGLPDVARDAIEQRNRLVVVLQSYQADRSIKNVNHFVNYPLVTKESDVTSRKQVVANIFREMEAEQARLKQNLVAAQKLAAENGTAGVSLALDLHTVQQDFKNLKYRMDRFQTWLSSYDVAEPETNFDQWADLAGSGLAEIAFQELDKRAQSIELYSQNIASIDLLLRNQKSELETKLKNFEKEMRKIEEELLNEQVRLDKLEHETYFQHSYFDSTESEGSKTTQTHFEELMEKPVP